MEEKQNAPITEDDGSITLAPIDVYSDDVYEEEREKASAMMAQTVQKDTQELTEAQVLKDPEFVNAYGTVAAYMGKDIQGTTQEDLAREGLQFVSDMIIPLTTLDNEGLAGLAQLAYDADPQTKQAMAYLYNTVENKDTTWSGFARGLKSVGKDPSLYAGVATGGWSFFGREAAKDVVKRTIGTMLVSGMATSAYMGAEEAIVQEVEDTYGDQPMDWNKVQQMSEMGAIMGLSMPLAFEGGIQATKAAGRGIKQGVESLYREGEELAMQRAGGGSGPKVKSGGHLFNSEKMEYYADTDYKSREKMVEMNIDDFLDLAEYPKGGYEREKIDAVKKAINEGKELETIPFLTTDGEQVVGHEGRHRAIALKELGYESMPVSINDYNIRWSEQTDPKYFDYKDNLPTILRSENDGSKEITHPLTRENVMSPYDVFKREGTPGTAAYTEAIMASEALPSTGKLEGRLIKQMPIEKQAEYHQAIQGVMTDENGYDIAVKAAGLKQTKSAQAPSFYEGHVGVSEQTYIEIPTTVDEFGFEVPTAEAIEKLKKAAAIKGYVQDQDAVVNRFITRAAEGEEDSMSIMLDRAITDDEMRSVINAVEDAGYDMDNLAFPTSEYGLDVLNVSFGELDNAEFKKISGIIDDVLDNPDIAYGKNALLEDGYVGGFEGFQSGQKAYKEILDADSTINTGVAKEDQLAGISTDFLEQKRAEVREATRSFIEQNPGKAKTIRQIGEESDEAVKAAGRQLELTDHSPKAKEQLSSTMVEEADAVLKGGDKEARGWYTSRFQKAIDKVEEEIPELKHPDQRDLFTGLVAILSDGASVSQNMKNAKALYKNFIDAGRIDNMEIPGPRGASYQKNLTMLQGMIDEHGIKDTMRYLNEYSTVKEAEAKFGQKISGFGKNDQVPNAVLFGPKLGMFFSNLSGHPDNLTMDRWWSRSFNRYRGQMTIQPTEQAYNTFRDAIGRPGMRAGTIEREAEKIAKAWAKRGYKNGTPLEKAANNIFKAKTGLRDAPMGVKDRNFQINVTKDAVEKLKKKGYKDMNVADLQAILWYNEKRLMRERGSRSPINEIDYLDVAGDK